MRGLFTLQQERHHPSIGVRYAASAMDQMNYIVRQVADQQLHCVLTFSSPIDIPTLQRGIQLTLDVEPVLGCKFVEHKRRAYWERRADMDSSGVCQLVQTGDGLRQLWQFILSPADPRKDSLVQVRVFRQQQDVLCVKMNHVVADAMGTKQYLYWLANIYQHLCQDAAYIPQNNIRAGRDELQLLRCFNLHILYKAYRHRFSPTPTWGFPRRSADFSGLGFAILRIPPARLLLLKEYGHAHRATLNDILITAYYRSLFTIMNPPTGVPLPIGVPVDLRRYLPASHPLPVCNYSGSVFPSLAREIDEDFEGTLLRVRDTMNTFKADTPGLHSAIYQAWSFVRGYEAARAGLQAMQALGMRYGTYYPMLTNFGIIEDQRLAFGTTTPTDAYMVSPLFFPPGFMVGANTFRDILTITAGFSYTATDKEIVLRFMELFARELPGDGLIEPGIALIAV